MKTLKKKSLTKKLTASALAAFILLQPVGQVPAFAEEILPDTGIAEVGTDNRVQEVEIPEIVWDEENRFDGTGLFDGGDGSYEDPYLISSRDQLELLHNDKSGNTHYKLTQDIDLSGEEWTPIEDFGGSIDGGGHAIIGMTIKGKVDFDVIKYESPIGRVQIGFIATVNPDSNLEIKNLNMQDSEIEMEFKGVQRSSGLRFNNSLYEDPGSARKDLSSSVGHLIGDAFVESGNQVLLENVHVEGVIKQNEYQVNSFDSQATGGIVGRATSLVGNELSYNGSIHGSSQTGGLIGSTQALVDEYFFSLTNSHTKADIKGINAIGGLVGSISSPYIDDPPTNFPVVLKGNRVEESTVAVTAHLTSTHRSYTDYYVTTQVGGLAGVIDSNTDVILHNNEVVDTSLEATGLVAGAVGAMAASEALDARDNHIRATITSHSGKGGFFGKLGMEYAREPSVLLKENSVDVDFEKVSKFSIAVPGSGSGGLIGDNSTSNKGKLRIENNKVTFNKVEDSYAGGLIGSSLEGIEHIYKNNEIIGDVGGDSYAAGGVIGAIILTEFTIIEDETATVHFEGNQFDGKVSGQLAGGTIGVANSPYGDEESLQEMLPSHFIRDVKVKIVETKITAEVVSSPATGIYGLSEIFREVGGGGVIGGIFGFDQIAMATGSESSYRDNADFLIKNSYVETNIRGEGFLGGLVGVVNDGFLDVENSYYNGVIAGNSETSGLIGKTTGFATINLKNAFAYPLFEDEQKRFSLVSHMEPATILLTEDVYAWDVVQGVESEDATMFISKDNAMKRSTYESLGWDFENLWGIKEGQSLPYFGESVVPAVDYSVIEKYVRVAEVSKRDPHITNAIQKIEAMPDGPEKDAFNARMDALMELLSEQEYQRFLDVVKKNLEWASKYEREPYVSAVGDNLGDVRDDERSEIEEEYNAIYEGMTEREKAAALKNATTLVGFAERYEREPYLSRAEAALEATPPSDEKTALEARFNAVMEKLGQAVEERKLVDATEAVEKAETAGSIFAIEEAQAIVDELKDGADKDALTDRLAAIEITEEMLAVYELKLTIAGIEDADVKALFEKAYNSVETAEQKGSRYTAAADEAVAALDPYTEDEMLAETVTTITDHLDRVKHGQAVQAAVTTAENAVSTAERYSRDMYVTRADDALTALQELDPEYDTAELEARLQVVKDKLADAAQAANIANAEKQIGYAERYKRDPYISRAQAAIDVLQDGETKTALQERLDAVMN